jgi:biopolymer transport protein TolR
MKAAADSHMLQTWRRPASLFSDFNTPQFASVMSMVVFVVLIIFMTMPTPLHGMYPNLPKVNHSVPMPWADRDDAMIVNVTRDGKVYFGPEQVTAAMLRERIADHLKDHTVERKVYVKADMRARWGTVKQVLEGVHAAGLMCVAFLVDQRRSGALQL